MSEIAFDAFCYMVFVGGFQALLTILLATVLAVVMLSRRNLPFMRWMACYFIFNVWFLVFGIVGNFVWKATATGWLYQNHDPVVEFIPFVIPGNWTIDPVCGGTLTAGTSWVHMYLVWLVIALPVWMLTVFAYCKTKPFIMRKLTPSGIRAVLALEAVAAIVGTTVLLKMMFS